MTLSLWHYGDTSYDPLAKPIGTQSEPTEPGFNSLSAYKTALDELRHRALEQFSSAQIDRPGPETWRWVEQTAQSVVQELNDQGLSAHAQSAFDKPDDVIVQALLNDIFGMGPVEELMRLPDVEDIALNGPDDIWYKRRGRWEKSDLRYPDAGSLLLTLNRAIVHTGRQAGPLTPIVDATLRAGHRINIVTQPLADPYPVAAIRIHRERKLSMEDLVASGGADQAEPERRLIPDYFSCDTGQGMFSALAATFLNMAVVAGFNILVVGSTGVGKTTVLGALGRMIPPERRILIIEDTPELKIRAGENCVSFTTRPETVEGLPAIRQDALVRAALRQRPDALTVGEGRGAEVFDMLKALWTGHRNGLTSIHADSLEDIPNRIRMMLQEANFQTEVTEATVALWIAKAFHLGLMLRMTETGRRYVEEIAEFTGGVESAVPVRNTLFHYEPGVRRLVCTGHRLHDHHEALLRQSGYTYDAIVRAATERGEQP
jgi:Flp pilus assembly CpaF family ATPase